MYTHACQTQYMHKQNIFTYYYSKLWEGLPLKLDVAMDNLAVGSFPSTSHGPHGDTTRNLLVFGRVVNMGIYEYIYISIYMNP